MMNVFDKIARWLCKFESDKYVHLLVCLVLAFAIARKSVDWGGAESGAAVIIGIGFGSALAVVKEIVDLRRKDVADIRDLLSGVVGSLMGSLMILI